MIQISSNQYFALFVATFALVGLLTPIMRKVAIKNGIIDHPIHAHKTHDNPIPYLGGVAIIVGIVAVSYAALLVAGRPATDFWTATSLLLPATILGVIGFFDDKRNLPPLPRFIAQSIAGIATAAILIATDTMGNPTGSSALDALITIVWVVAISNSINFFDNLDGGAAGAVAVTSLGLFTLAQASDQLYLSALAITTFGAMLGFLLWNKSPARIYMGDAGALFLGVLVAVLALRIHPEVDTKFASFAIPILLLAIPILDTSVAVLSRLRRRISPFQGGRDHLSHRLMRLGLSKRNSAYVLWGLSGYFVGIALLISNAQTGERSLVLWAAGFWILLFIAFFVQRDSD